MHSEARRMRKYKYYIRILGPQQTNEEKFSNTFKYIKLRLQI